jgi:hypothetical protein
MTEYTPTKITPDRSAPLRFNGKLIAHTEWETNRGDTMRFEIWETQGGALIAVREGDGDDGYTDALVVEPTGDWSATRTGEASFAMHPPFAMVDAVLTFFQWHDRARSMVKPLRWRMTREVA